MPLIGNARKIKKKIVLRSKTKKNNKAIVLKVTVREESENKYRIVLEIVGENGTRYCDFECAPDCMIEKIADDLCEMTTNLKKYGIVPASINVLGD